jgi:hypothetical protein
MNPQRPLVQMIWGGPRRDIATDAVTDASSHQLKEPQISHERHDQQNPTPNNDRDHPTQRNQSRTNDRHNPDNEPRYHPVGGDQPSLFKAWNDPGESARTVLIRTESRYPLIRGHAIWRVLAGYIAVLHQRPGIPAGWCAFCSTYQGLHRNFGKTR